MKGAMTEEQTKEFLAWCKKEGLNPDQFEGVKPSPPWVWPPGWSATLRLSPAADPDRSKATRVF